MRGFVPVVEHMGSEDTLTSILEVGRMSVGRVKSAFVLVAPVTILVEEVACSLGRHG